MAMARVIQEVVDATSAYLGTITLINASVGLVLSLALVALWLLLNNSLGLGQWLMALLLGWLVPWLTHSLRPTPVRFSHPWVALRLFFQVGPGGD